MITDEQVDIVIDTYWKETSVSEQEQIDALKAQVNCLRNCLQQARNDKDREAFERCYGRTLASTSEQCLAEVKVRAIKELIEKNTFSGYGWSNGTYFNSLENYLKVYVSQLLEQAK